MSGVVDFLQTSKEPCDLVLPHSAKEDDGCAKTRLDHAFVVNCANDVPFGHWKNVMECILQLPHVTESGIRRIIQDALASAQGKVLSAVIFRMDFP